MSALFVGSPSPLMERIGGCLDDAGILLESRQTASEAELTHRLTQGTDLIMVDASTSGISNDRVMDLRKEAQSNATIIFLVNPRDDKSATATETRERCDIIPQNDLHQLVRTVRRAMVEKMVRPEVAPVPSAQDTVLEKELNGLLQLIQDDAQQLLSAQPRDSRALTKAHQIKHAAENTVRLVQHLLDLGQAQTIETKSPKARRSS